ncbi:MAG TPA: hypothetical protein VIX61_04835 [Casimicrobiaceae bacterium]
MLEPGFHRPHLHGVETLYPPERAPAATLADAMVDADFVLIDDEVYEADYLRVPDEFTVADDVVIEASRGDTEIALTRAEIDGAQHLGEGVFRLRNGAQLRFLASATIH